MSMSEDDVLAFVPILTQYLDLQTMTAGLLLKKMRRRRALLSVMIKKLEKSKRSRGTLCLSRGIAATGLMREILAGNETATMDNLHVSANALRVLVRKIGAKRHGWGVKSETALFLYWLASGFNYKAVSETFDVPHSTTNRTVNKILTAIVNIVNKEIHTPPKDDIDEVCDGFVEHAQASVFTLCGGSLTTKYIHGIIDNKTYNIRMQILANHLGHIIDLFVSSGHIDPLSRSRLLREGKYPPPGFYILASNEYPCMTGKVNIVTPYKVPSNDLELEFNNIHSRIMQVSDQTVGMLESRWPLIFLQDHLDIEADKCIQIVAVCSIIHNICLKTGDVRYVNAKKKQQNVNIVEDRLGGDVLRRYFQKKLVKYNMEEKSANDNVNNTANVTVII